jgi:hypothetical protein
MGGRAIGAPLSPNLENLNLLRSYRLAVRSSPFQGENTGSNPVRTITLNRFNPIVVGARVLGSEAE